MFLETSATLSAPTACSLENFRDIDFHLSLWFILCLYSLQALPDSSVSISVSLLWNSPIRISTRSSEPIRFPILLIPISIRIPDTYWVSLLGIHRFDVTNRFEQPISSLCVNSSFFLPCYLLVKFILEEKARFCKLSLQFSRLAIA
jgi:hypothetical protein